MLLLIRSVFTWWASASVSSGSMSLSITSSGIDPEDTCGLIIQHDNWSWDHWSLLSSQILLWLIIVITWAWLARGTRTVFESIRSDSERRPVSSTSLEPVLIMTVAEWNDSGCAWVEHEEEHKEEEEDDRGQGRPTVNLSKTFSGSWFRHHPAPQWKFQLAPRTHCSLWKYQYQNDVKRYSPTPQSGLMCFWQLSQLSLTNGSIPLCTDQSKYSVKRMDSHWSIF